ncbi:MAG TPA: glycosyltransferase family 4 protein [Stellaceae bacterium]|nr:glycosyltransferase family 4 protein [Stellaceae bacterium]
MTPSAPLSATAAPASRRGKLLFLVTEDWYFCSHRLPLARAARDAGFEVAVATRVRRHGERIREEGFALHPIAWRRRGDGPLAAARAVAAIAALYRAERPDIVHHVALKPVLFGALAARLAFRAAERPAQIAAVMGLGSGFAGTGLVGRLRQAALRIAIRLAAGRRRAANRVIVQNREDRDALARFGVPPAWIALIRGSGVDITRFQPMSDPAVGEIEVALVARMLRAKGVLDAVEAVRRLRNAGEAVALLLVGPTDPDNPDTLTSEELAALAAQPGVEWLGRVEDVAAVWRRAAIAVLPTTYGEGVPLALLEAAACARPIVASDMPGCREVVRHGETGLLVPPRDTAALAAAIAALARDPARRREMGLAGRDLVEREFAEEVVTRQTLALYEAALAERGEGG